jgi:hypothetical protein
MKVDRRLRRLKPTNSASLAGNTYLYPTNPAPAPRSLSPRSSPPPHRNRIPEFRIPAAFDVDTPVRPPEPTHRHSIVRLCADQTVGTDETREFHPLVVLTEFAANSEIRSKLVTYLVRARYP